MLGGESARRARREMEVDRSTDKFAQTILQLAPHYPAARTIHQFMDNLNTHRRKSLVDLYAEEPGGEIWDWFTIHYTPKHGNWVNRAELEIGLFER